MAKRRVESAWTSGSCDSGSCVSEPCISKVSGSGESGFAILWKRMRACNCDSRGRGKKLPGDCWVRCVKNRALDDGNNKGLHW